LAETIEYDKIFAALKHPIRRQILLLLEDKNEMSFTDIQNAVGLEDTGLLSYHLKELEFLVRQSARGKYSLSEVGEVSMALFRKVEREKQLSDLNVQNYFGRLVGKIAFLLFIIGITLMAPLSADIYLSIQSIHASSLLTEQIFVMFLASFLGMTFGIILFVFYDYHYYSKSFKTNVVHSTIFAIGISLLSISSAYITRSFELGTASGSNVAWFVSILRTVSFVASTPITTYLASRLMKGYFSTF
jgi:DNA-binding transcriptional ArsR family regulator